MRVLGVKTSVLRKNRSLRRATTKLPVSVVKLQFEDETEVLILIRKDLLSCKSKNFHLKGTESPAIAKTAKFQLYYEQRQKTVR